MLVLGGYMIWTLNGQLKEIRQFADTEAKPVLPVQPTADQITALRAKIDAFGAAVGRNEKAALNLSVEEINSLLASEPEAAPMKQNAKVESIGDTVKVQISVAMNGTPFSGERLYINGMADLFPEKNAELGIKLLTRSLTIPGKTVSEGFLDHYKQNNHLDTLLLDGLRNSKNPAILEVLKKLTTVRLEAGSAVLEFSP